MRRWSLNEFSRERRRTRPHEPFRASRRRNRRRLTSISFQLELADVDPAQERGQVGRFLRIEALRHEHPVGRQRGRVPPRERRLRARRPDGRVVEMTDPDAPAETASRSGHEPVARDGSPDALVPPVRRCSAMTHVPWLSLALLPPPTGSPLRWCPERSPDRTTVLPGPGTYRWAQGPTGVGTSGDPPPGSAAARTPRPGLTGVRPG